MGTLLIIVAGILVGFLIFIRPALGLGIILLSALFLPEIEFGSVGVSRGIQAREISVRPEDFFIMLVGIGWFVEAAIRGRMPSIIHNPLNIPILVLTLVMISATILGIAQGTTTFGAGILYTLKKIQYFIVFFLIIGNVKTFKEVKSNITLLIIFSVVVALWSIVEYFFLVGGVARITGPFMRKGQPPILGGFFLMIIFLGISFFMRYTEFRKRIPMLIIVVISFLVIIFTKTRSSYVGAFIGLIAFGIIFRKPALLAIPILLVITIDIIFPTVIAERIHTIGGIWQRGETTSPYAPSWDVRVATWKEVMPEIMAYPLLGKGAGCYSLAWLDNQYVTDLLYMGVIGLGVFIWLLFRIFKTVFYLSKSPPPSTPSEGIEYSYVMALSAGYLGGLIALIIHGMAVTTFYNIRTMIPFWFLTGLVIVSRDLFLRTEDIKSPLTYNA
ncbi:MAG: O-antigen ligase family protein [Planctomycetota bacterium]